MKNKFNLVLILILLALSGCSEKKTEKSSAVPEDTISQTDTKSIILTAMATEGKWTAGEVDTCSNPLEITDKYVKYSGKTITPKYGKKTEEEYCLDISDVISDVQWFCADMDKTAIIFDGNLEQKGEMVQCK